MNQSHFTKRPPGPNPSFWRQDYSGLGCFVPLDYGSRYEHSVIVVPRDWDAMYDLICAPQTFMEGARHSYGMGTPTDAAHAPIPWTMEWPITIMIRPLTEATQRTRHTLNLLNGYYKFQQLLDEWELLRPAEFRAQVIGAANDPQDPPILTHAKGPVTALDPWTPFDLKFVAEFAIDTRVLHIMYVPQIPMPDGANQRYQSHITPATWSQVGRSDLHFLHFDVDFGTSRTYQTVAEARAQLAMDYIVDPSIVNTWLGRINMTPNPAPPHSHVITPPSNTTSDPHGFYVADGSLAEAGQMGQILQTPAPSQAPISFTAPNRDVSVVIDSVWPVIPDGKVAAAVKRRNDIVTLSTDPPPPPYLCINIATDGSVLGDGTVKWYQPPTPPGGTISHDTPQGPIQTG